MQTDVLQWISIGTLLIYVPFLCYFDWKYRDIGTHAIWLPLLAVNIPIVAAGYATGAYPPFMVLVTSVISTAWFLLFYRKGADCVWLILITMIVVVHPVSGVIFLYPFLMYLVIFTSAAIWAVFLDNRIKTGMWQFQTERGVPYLIPISCALIVALVM